MKSDRQIIFDQAVTISDLTQENIYLTDQLIVMEEKIRQFYDLIERHEKTIRDLKRTQPNYNPMNRSGNL